MSVDLSCRMKSYSIFLLFSAALVVSAVPGCPDGFTFLNNYYCVQLFTDAKNFDDSQRACQSLNAKLVTVHNSIDNKRLAQLAGSLKIPVWIGLKCNAPVNSTTCYWQDNTGFTESYNNFAPGNPTVPEPVTMVPFGASAGRWYSADGSKTMAARFCMLTPLNQCPDTYNGYCYTTHIANATVAEARRMCQTNCGDLPSIHDYRENDFIRDLFNIFYPLPTYAHIGVIATKSNKTWMDGTAYNFDNFGYFNPNIGQYAAIALSSKASVGVDQWISVDDPARLPFVCKKKIGAQCGPTLAPTVTPLDCRTSQFLNGNGTFYSPNYPYSYTGPVGTCTYIVTQPLGSFAQVRFPELVLDPLARMSLYAYIEDNQPPFAVLSSKNEPTGWIKSSTNVLRIVFSRSNPGLAIDYEWKAEYSFSDHA